MKKKKRKLYQPVVDCTVSNTLFVCPVKARHKLLEMIQEIPWGEQHYFDRWAETLEPGDSYGFGSADSFGDKTLIEAYISVLELEE